jgi:hypothetical protein
MASGKHKQTAIRLLMGERKDLCARAAGGPELEPTRLELGCCQQELARALVARCLHRPDRDAT